MQLLMMWISLCFLRCLQRFYNESR
jgi:hypothetical protein